MFPVVLMLVFSSITETLHSNENLPSLSPARYYCCTDQSCLGDAAPEGLTTVPHEMHDWYSKSMQKLQARNPPPKAIRRCHFIFLSCIVLPNIFPRCLRLKTLNDFFCHALVPLLCRVVRCRKKLFIDPCPQN